MSSPWLSWFAGKPSSGQQREKARDAIVELRSQLVMLDKKEEHLNKKIAEELSKAKANATTNKRIATSALRQKKMYETELEQLSGRRITFETQLHAIESAAMNAAALQVIKQGHDALKDIHTGMNIDKVDKTMDDIREQMELSKEITDAISNPLAMGAEIDEDELKAELNELEQEELNDRLVGASSVPVFSPPTPVSAAVTRTPAQTQQEADEDAELRELQAALAM